MKLIKMKRELLPGATGPTTADVHPAEVENFKAEGWAIVEESEKAEPIAAEPEAEPAKKTRKK